MRATQLLHTTLHDIVRDMGLSWPEKAVIEPPKDAAHGDLAANVALVLAREAKTSPRELAARIAAALMERSSSIAKAEVAGPGFLNVTFSPDFWRQTVLEVESAGPRYGTSAVGAGRKTMVEYVSANPTGPLHIGHGRGAAVGDTLARLLRFAGYDVTTEYYINDAGRQMRLLGVSVWLRAREVSGLHVDWPQDFYRGGYIADIARELLRSTPDLLQKPDAEAQEICYEYAMRTIMDGIKADLARFRVEHQVWFSEKSLVDRGAVEQAFARLEDAEQSPVVQEAFARFKEAAERSREAERNRKAKADPGDAKGDRDEAFTEAEEAALPLVTEKNGALWFLSRKLGDDRNRVLRKSDGSLTYFASDIAYHNDKFARGYDYLIDVWGADHHGYIPRMRAAITALGRNPEDFAVVLIQLVNLLENGTPISMSTRAGTFETLADVVKEVGVDAARFMFLSRKSDSPLDFDLELVKQRNMDNPVYYVQYAHARICAVLRRAAERGLVLPDQTDLPLLAGLNTPEDFALLRMMERFEDMIASASANLAVHHISRYLMDLSGQLHSYYAKHQVLQAGDDVTTTARLALLRAVGQVVRNGLELLGVSAPESM